MELFDPAPPAPATASAQIPIDGRLDVDVYNTLTYGNNFDGNLDADGIISFQFDADGGALTLNVEGFDIDSGVEISVLVNREFVGFLTVTPDGDLGFSQLEIDAALVLRGSNTLTFAQTGAPTQTWGVTNLFLASPGLKELPFYYDPEFTEDGWVGWQVDHDGFYLGRMDMNTGGFLGVVNHIDVPPITWFETVQAVEMITTTDGGVAAIGMTEQGLVYLSATEAYVLEGTVGMHFNAMPKGEVSSLRFVCADENNLQYLYDDGELTQLPVFAGQAWQWLNDHQVLMRNNTSNLLAVLNVETMTMEPVTDNIYGRGGAAAITTTTGEQMITMQGDGFRDIYVREEAGWQLTQRIVSPLEVGDQFFSPEFFEWQGRVWLLGYLSPEVTVDWTAPTAVILYDIDHDLWIRLSDVDDGWKDPEVLVLNDGTLAWYADDTSETRQLFDTISYETAMKRGLLTEILSRAGTSGLAQGPALQADDLPLSRPASAPLDLPALAAWRTQIADVTPQARTTAMPEARGALPALSSFSAEADGFDFLGTAVVAGGEDDAQDVIAPPVARVGGTRIGRG